MVSILPVILCGGFGTRLWPLSRAGFPKQFLCLTGNQSLFQNTVQRVMALRSESFLISPPCIVTNEEHRFLVSEQLRETRIECGPVLLEPTGRNTAPALTLAALAAQATGADPLLVVTPADHQVTELHQFLSATEWAIREANSGGIVVLGVPPDRPETGFGYIKAGEATSLSRRALDVIAFHEKPTKAVAERYLVEGGHFWNAGMFMLKASVWLAALEHFRPDIARATRTAWANRSTDRVGVAEFTRPGHEEFAVVPAESIDISVMERCAGSKFSLKMVPLDAGWCDLGSWDAVWSNLSQDSQGNASRGDVLMSDTKDTLVHASSRLVCTAGVQDLIVVETPDAVMVAHRASSESIKAVVTGLEIQRRAEVISHRKTHRPWGWYDVLDTGPQFKVKRIWVRPGASLSLQKHKHRAEHWIVVKGCAEITRGTQTTTLTANQSSYIPPGEAHRLSNPGSEPLEIIEVQSGDYLGEDDIIRISDEYGRDMLQPRPNDCQR
ncbi:MAG: mannose-1-phosphate guanylyltransferase/mannose-6-phosphate isomerase [Ramlibacter sp.]|nr:mannose-1-phosphate guanylyltransferase/mannose-6-phosphate isomerase [Ramlibacter sp.]